VRVLLDECVPRRLQREVTGLDVSHVADEGWQGRRNSDLLGAMLTARFTHLITVDRNLQFQQNIVAAGVGVLVLRAPTNRFADLRPLMAQVQAVLPTVQPGQVIHVGV